MTGVQQRFRAADRAFDADDHVSGERYMRRAYRLWRKRDGCMRAELRAIAAEAGELRAWLSGERAAGLGDS